MSISARNEHAQPAQSPSARSPLLNAITVDVEDWGQSVVNPDCPLTDLFRANTDKILEAFARHDVRGTFFVLGLAAEKAPDVVRAIAAAGHEVQSHGYGHRWVHTQTPAAFRADVDRSKKLLEDMIGRSVTGYRAPAFTIIRESLWALDILAETGFQYDSSIFPLRARWYGITGAPWYPHRLRTPSGAMVTEIPVASYRVLGRRIPAGGGGYLRLAPSMLFSAAIRQINRAGHNATIYMHPHEFGAPDFDQYASPVSWRTKLHQGIGRRGFPAKIEYLLKTFRFGTICDAVGDPHRLPLHEYDTASPGRIARTKARWSAARPSAGSLRGIS